MASVKLDQQHTVLFKFNFDKNQTYPNLTLLLSEYGASRGYLDFALILSHPYRVPQQHQSHLENSIAIALPSSSICLSELFLTEQFLSMKLK